MEPLNLLLFIFAQLKRHNIIVTSNSWLQMDKASGVQNDFHLCDAMF